MEENATGNLFAVVDLGSNSFHMLVARHQDGKTQVIDRIKEMVQLAAGMDSYGSLDAESLARAESCLQRFSQRLSAIPTANVRAVGTNTLRQCANREQVIARFEAALGQPIAVISGHEEARLIYLGASEVAAPLPQPCLVMDIGGGSTELIIGYGAEILFLESLNLGCVSWAKRFFADGMLSREKFAQAVLAAALEIQAISQRLPKVPWQSALGSSGTMKSVDGVLREMGFSTIQAEGLLLLQEKIFKFTQVEELDLPGLSPERRQVFVPGLAIIVALFQALGLTDLKVANSALREGVLADMLGRIAQQDVREVTVSRMQRYYEVDIIQAKQVAETADYLWQQLALSLQIASKSYRETLRFAAALHEIGLAISHSGYHKHGAYILYNADMSGFSWQEQALLAVVVGSHRRKLTEELLLSLPKDQQRPALYLIVFLRLAVLLHRNRLPPQALPVVEIEERNKLPQLNLRFPEQWLLRHPLTYADLEQEKDFLKKQIIINFS
jgi:exopolyphosphatase/guanosine-5'-triphosphate,3'-diphosphate pyrophosphatase